MNLRPTNHQYRSSRRAIFVNSVGATNLPPSHQVFSCRLYLGIGCGLKTRTLKSWLDKPHHFDSRPIVWQLGDSLYIVAIAGYMG
jgi:hypothetical protein